MGKWAQAEADGCCYNCGHDEGYDNLVSANGWPVCVGCAEEIDREEQYE